MKALEKQGFDGPNFSGPTLLGHRGMGVGPGENTLASLVDAVRAGADGIECDVRRTADGALALHHDPIIPGAGMVAELTVAQLPERVPLLEAVLDALLGSQLNLEIKNLPNEPGYDPEELTARQVVTLLAERGGRDSVIISSFTSATLDAVVSTDPDLATGFLTTADYDQDKALARAVERGWSALHPHHRAVTAELVAAAHDQGLALNTWTVNDPDDALRLAGMGVDAVITDAVGAILSAFGRGAGGAGASAG
ncbi:MAG TPA: glycerophosphodiester phosphodiesterase [Acidimicrobiales bacterium]|nr:glycerophosphodiester phosphodiesterase [Acidimicrobiales bacterium]